MFGLNLAQTPPELIDESLHFYLSTNTFSNPIFEPSNLDNQLDDQNLDSNNDADPRNGMSQNIAISRAGPGLEDPLVETNNYETYYDIKDLDSHGVGVQSKVQNAKTLSRKQSNGYKERDKGLKARLAGCSFINRRKWCKEFCDNLLFSIKSKLFVFELDMKRRVRTMKKYASKHLPWSFRATNGLKKGGGISFTNSLTPGQLNNSSSRIVALGSGASCIASGSMQAYCNYDGNYAHPTTDCCQSQSNQQQCSSSSRIDRSVSKDKFWLNIGPYSLESFGSQQVRILERLEQVVEAKRSQTRRREELLNINGQAGPLDGGNSTMDQGNQGHQIKWSSGASSKRKTNAPSKQATKEPNGNRTNKRIHWISAGARRIKISSNEKDLDLGACQKRLCVVCYSNPSNIVTLPCKHNEICSDCFIEIIYMTVKQSQYPLKCVLCRQKVERIKCPKKLLLNVLERNRTHKRPKTK